jgi:type I restriction enzyme S subunit
MSQWPTVPLGEVLDHRKEFIEINDLERYKRCRVQLHAQGIVLRDNVPGAEIKTKKQQVCNSGEFLVAEIDAKLGGYGIVPTDLDGAIVSSHYFLFGIREERLDRSFLGYFIRTPGFFEQVAAQGSTNYAAIRPGHVLEYKIPLPPLPEQRRLVERIDALATKIREAIGLRQQAVEESVLLAARSLENLRRRVLEKTNRVVPLCEVAKVTAGGTPSRDNPAFWGGTIPWIKTGELLDGDITTAAEHITDAGVSSSSAKLFPIDTVLIALYGQGQTRGRTGRLLIPATTNQACAAILPCDDLRPRYVQYWLRSLYREMREENHGGAQPNWNGQMIKDIRIAVPSLKEQEQIICECDASTSNFERLSQHQDNVKAELDAMLPAILDRAFRGEW